MEIAEKRVGGALVLRPTGRLDGAAAPGFEKTVLDRISDGPARLVLDLAAVDYVSSAGLRAILVAAKRGKTAGCPVAVSGLRDHIREVFELSGFHHLVPVHPTVEEALRS